MFVKGKTIAVTGAGKGIGHACVNNFLRNGANVVALTRSEEDTQELREEHGDKNFEIINGDVCSRDDLIALLRLGCERFGGVNGLVNNAGIRQRKKFFEITEEDWENVISNNLTSCFNGTQIFARHMVDRGGGSIVNISSIIGMTGLPDLSGYASSKAGIIGFTKAVATELASQKVRINVLCPGFVRTSFAQDFEVQKPELHRFTLERTPMKRWGEPEEVVHFIAFLLSDLSSYATGGVYPVDGGWTAC